MTTKILNHTTALTKKYEQLGTGDSRKMGLTKLTQWGKHSPFSKQMLKSNSDLSMIFKALSSTPFPAMWKHHIWRTPYEAKKRNLSNSQKASRQNWKEAVLCLHLPHFLPSAANCPYAASCSLIRLTPNPCDKPVLSQPFHAHLHRTRSKLWARPSAETF